MINDFRNLPALCAYCGSGEDLTKEHVIPKSFAGDNAENWEPIIVWACKTCNNQKSSLDNKVKVLLAADTNAYQSETARNILYGSVSRGVAKGKHRDFQRLFARMTPDEIVDESGEVVASGMGAKLEEDPFTPWFGFVIKGLGMALWNAYFELPEYFEVGRFFKNGYSQIKTMLVALKAPEPCPIGKHTKFSIGQFPGQPIGHGLWVFQFFDDVVFVAFVFNKEIGEEITKSMKE